jgi:enoyl-CoA hydratase/carnithine racemase
VDLRVTLGAVRDGVSTITLNRPERLNAWTGRMEAELRHLLTDADRDPKVRVIVITGAGRGFCSGADTSALEKEAAAGTYDPGVPADAARPGHGIRPDFEHTPLWLLGMRKPVIAAINGAAAGVGLVLACCCDVRFAAEGAKLTAAHGRLGLPAEMGLSWLLPRLIGAGRAADVLLSSRIVLAEEAVTMGMVNRAVPATELMNETYAYCKVLVEEISPQSLLATKRQLWADLLGDLDTAARDARRRLEGAMASADFAEGVEAFREKRPPRFPPLPAG